MSVVALLLVGLGLVGLGVLAAGSLPLITLGVASLIGAGAFETLAERRAQ
jgi:hypothetical protein